jgi:16S rRNA (cytosine967-C5)-methyltransferase
MGIAPARAAAFHILLGLETRTGHSDDLLRSAAVSRLSEQDRHLATTLVMGTLRWQSALDSRVAGFLKRPDSQLEVPVRLTLRMGAFQLLHLDRIPAHAAIDESVELAKRHGQAHAAGMVNAVLRRLATAPRAPLPDPRNAAELSSMYAHPYWLVERWVAVYGLARATTICQFDQDQAPTSLRLLAAGAEEALLAEGIELAPGTFLTQARRVVQGDITGAKSLREGLVRIQDEGSQLVAELAGHGNRILDTCAAPGGKTAILAKRNPAARIVASDASGKRLEEMRCLMPVDPRISYRVADAAKTMWGERFDLILCDVPCSGTGTLARNPEIRHRLDAAELKRQQVRQIAILRAAMAALEPGGRLIYSTCSLEPEENEAVVSACLAAIPGFRIEPLEGELDALTSSGVLTAEGSQRLRESAMVKGCLRTLPGVHPCDGFFAALLTRAG